MSVEATDWARHKAPMIRTDAGKPDSTSRAILAELAEHADKFGAECFPSVLHMQWATGYDERTIQRALARLKAGLLISPVGLTREGCVKWQLHMGKERPDSDMETLLKAAEEKAQQNARYQAKHRKKVKGVDASGTETPLPIDGDVSTSGDVRDSASLSKELSVPTSGILRPNVRDAAPPEPSVNHQENHQITITGGAPPPDPRRPESPSAPRNEHENSISMGGDQPPIAETFTHDRAREANTDGFIPPPQCGYPDCNRGWILPLDDTPPYQCPNCNSNVVPFRERRTA